MEAICCLPAAVLCIRPRHPTSRSLCLSPLVRLPLARSTVRHLGVSLAHVPLEEDHGGRAWGAIYFGASTTARGSGRRVVMMMANGGGSPGNGAAQDPNIMQKTLDFLRATLYLEDYSTGQEVAQRMKVALSKTFNELLDDPTKNGFGSLDLYEILLTLTQMYIALKDYGVAQEVCGVALRIASKNDARPRLLMAIINMMLMVKNLLWTTKDFEDPEMVGLKNDAAKYWKEYKECFVSAPPDESNDS
ncbi:hypothetical protein MUK42_34788 [Musa troglodytarum]|uniref:Uncharacterized protein n=1 Tax=Musa troglodytarum TaxID=320322 RepID=A0A9E7KAV0_9LILI|nr:hypothetical protein MUK42_34788 [Musa troglodytarum]